MTPFADVGAWLLEKSAPRCTVISPLEHAGNRVLAEPVTLPQVPPYPIAAIDGLAVRAADTEGASDYAPIPLPGSRIGAGCRLPQGTDAVLSLAAFDEGPVALTTVAAGSFVVCAGHDAPGGTSLPAGTVLRPLHLAMLAEAHFHEVPVVRTPTVWLQSAPLFVSRGLVVLLSALIRAEWAFVTDHPCRVAGTEPPDLVLLLAGDRARISDTPPKFGMVESSGAECGPMPRVVMPADPVRCLTLFTLIVAPALRRMGGRAEPARVSAKLARKVTSALGQFDAIPVQLKAGHATPLGPAEGCSLLVASAAHGLLLVRESSEGYAEGASVEIIPLA